MYNFYLNGDFYGSGDLNYIHELFYDYVIACEMYGLERVSFAIEKNGLLSRGESVKEYEEKLKKVYAIQFTGTRDNFEAIKTFSNAKIDMGANTEEDGQVSKLTLFENGVPYFVPVGSYFIKNNNGEIKVAPENQFLESYKQISPLGKEVI